jgi:hypothetical protein
MAAVAAENDVAFFQIIDDTDRVGFLANVAMGRPEEFAGGKQIEDSFFESADQDHLGVELLASRVWVIQVR